MATAMLSRSVALVALSIIIALAAAPGALTVATSNAAAPAPSSLPSPVAACEAAPEEAVAAACNASRDVLSGNVRDVPSAAAAPKGAGMAPAETPSAPIIGVNATPTACILARETGFGGGGVISKFLHGPLQARSCAVKRNISLDLDHCFTLDADCQAMASRGALNWLTPSWESIREAENAIRGGALDAAFTVLKTDNLTGATPEAVGTACALARSPYILRDACNEHIDPCYHDWVNQGRCLDLFKKGESIFSNVQERNTGKQLTKLWQTNNPGVAIERVETNKDCCSIISSRCLCSMKKRILDQGNKLTVGCLKNLGGCS